MDFELLYGMLTYTEIKHGNPNKFNEKDESLQINELREKNPQGYWNKL